GEVMGTAPSFGEAFYKAQLGAGNDLHKKGAVFISVRDNDKREVISLAREIASFGYRIISTHGTGRVLQRNDIPVEMTDKIQAGGDNILNHLDELAFVINTPNHRGARWDESKIRSACPVKGIPHFTTLASAHALVGGLAREAHQTYQVRPLQELLRNPQLHVPTLA
ncbi:MAG: carbamoyl phosphate synthase large subunit, partial [Planctomycetota bacterium]